MKNVFQGLRGLPDYPRIIVRLIALLFVLFGIGNLVVGYTLNYPNRYDHSVRGQKYSKKDLETLRNLIPIVEQISFIQGMKPDVFEIVMDQYSGRLYYPELNGKLTDDVYPGTNPGGVYVIFWGALYLLTALLLIRGFRQTTLVILGLWIIYSCIILVNFITHIRGLPLFSDDIKLDEIGRFLLGVDKPSVLSIFVMIVVPLFIGILLLLDERLKAYFGRGKFAEAYKAYFDTKKDMRQGVEKKPLSNPWIGEKTS